MSTVAPHTHPDVARTRHAAHPTDGPATRPAPAPIPTSRVVAVELRKMFDTRSGFWMLAGIGILSLLATASVIAFAPDEVITFETFASAIGIPMSVILPMIAVLSVTSEYTQRSGLTTFTLVPHRGRVIAAKAVSVLAVGVGSMVVALSVGALGNVVGTMITGVDPVWDLTAAGFARIVLAMVLTMFVGFTLGVLIRNSAAAIVSYFVYALLLPVVFNTLAAVQSWFADLQPWVDPNYASTKLYEDTVSGADWAHLGVTMLVWLVLPLVVGLLVLRRAEVK